MYLLKNAWKNVTRSKGRNILIGIIVFVIAVSACISLSIRQAAETAKESGMSNTEVTGEISINRQAMMNSMGEDGADRSEMKEKMSEIKELSLTKLKSYAQLDSVKDFYYTLTLSMDASKIEAITTEDETDSDIIRPENNTDQGAFTLVGYSSEDAMSEFKEGTCKITKGENFKIGTNDKTCIISEELATYNSLKVGSTIQMVNPQDSSQKISLKVVGIYKNSSSTSGETNRFNGGTDPANKIYTSYETLKAVTKSFDNVMAQTNGTYVFSDIDDYQTFKNDVEEMGLDENYSVSSQDVNSYEQSILPLENLSKFAGYFFGVVLIIGAVVLIIIHIFNIRERKYEIGVLTAIGMKKSKVCIQFLMELFLVTLFAMMIGLAVGSAASVPVSNQLLETQIESQQQDIATQENNFGRGGKSSDDKSEAPQGPGRLIGQTSNYMTNISASVNLVVVAQLLGVGILLTLISGMVAVVFIVRYEPLKILSSRS